MSLSKPVNFYRNVVASQSSAPERGSGVYKIAPLSRFDYCGGIGVALIFLIEKVAKSIFFFIATLFTLGLNQNVRASFFTNATNGVCYVAAIALGGLGVVFPTFVNEKILGIPAAGSYSVRNDRPF